MRLSPAVGYRAGAAHWSRSAPLCACGCVDFDLGQKSEAACGEYPKPEDERLVYWTRNAASSENVELSGFVRINLVEPELRPAGIVILSVEESTKETTEDVPLTVAVVPLTNPVPRTVTPVPVAPLEGVTLPIPSGTTSSSTIVSPAVVRRKIWSPGGETARTLEAVWSTSVGPP